MKRKILTVFLVLCILLTACQGKTAPKDDKTSKGEEKVIETT